MEEVHPVMQPTVKQSFSVERVLLILSLVLNVILIGTTVYFSNLLSTTNGSISMMQQTDMYDQVRQAKTNAQIAQLATKQATPTPTIVPTSVPSSIRTTLQLPTNVDTTNWKTYQNSMYSVFFKYPPTYSIVFDKKPDPTGNPEKYMVELKDAKENVVSFTFNGTSGQLDFLALYDSIDNLPSGPATITAKEVTKVGTEYAVYVYQSNKQEGIAMLTSQSNLLFAETNTVNAQTLQEILSTVEFR